MATFLATYIVKRYGGGRHLMKYKFLIASEAVQMLHTYMGLDQCVPALSIRGEGQCQCSPNGVQAASHVLLRPRKIVFFPVSIRKK